MPIKNIFELAEKFGIKRGEMDEILFEIKVNNAQLDHCEKPHDFSIVIDRRTKLKIENPTPQQRFGAKLECSKCGGWIDSINASWYKRGLQDAFMDLSK